MIECLRSTGGMILTEENRSTGIWRRKLVWIIFKDAVPTSKKKQYFLIKKANCTVLGEIITVIVSIKRNTLLHRVGQVQRFVTLWQVAQIITTLPYSLTEWKGKRPFNAISIYLGARDPTVWEPQKASCISGFMKNILRVCFVSTANLVWSPKIYFCIGPRTDFSRTRF